MEFNSFFTSLIVSLVVFAQLVILLLVYAFAAKDKKIINFFGGGNKAMMFAFIIALLGTVGSLTYSEVIGYEPCKFCWFQRVFLYPQVLILGVALFRKDKNIFPYISGMSVVGGIIALYHYLMQLGWAPAVSCDAIGYSVSCSKVFIMSLGYITIPMMAFTAFALIFLLTLAYKKADR